MRNMKLGFRALQYSAQSIRFFPAIPAYIRGSKKKKLSVARSFNAVAAAVDKANRQYAEQKNGK